jgi:serine-type D-Ala-D-Ala carboxypeptidase (penicillin-binding protein 5/6)
VRKACAFACSLAFLVSSAAAEGKRAGPHALESRAAVLADAADGHVLYQRKARSRRPIASATKLMTALVALEELPVRRSLRAAPYRPGPLESQIRLQPGERMTVIDLMRALLLASANDAAVTLARGAAGSVPQFVARMNERARELGLSSTHYSNPIGLDQRGNYSSAADLFKLARRLLRNDTLASIVDLPSTRLDSGTRPREVTNRNDLVGKVPWIDGVKTGHTLQAGYVLVGSGTRNGVRLVSVVLGSPSASARDTDTLALLDYGFSRYRSVRALRAGADIASAGVAFYDDRNVKLTVRRDVRLSVRRGERVRTVVRAPGELEGPLDRGERVGVVRILRGGKLVEQVPLVTAEQVPHAGFLRRAIPYLRWLVVLVAGATLLSIAARRRA